MNAPEFKAHVHWALIPGDGVVVLTDGGSAKAFHGPAYEMTVPLIDGSRGTDAIVDALAGELDAARVYYVLHELEAAGFVAEATPGIPDSLAAFWYGAGIDPTVALARLRQKRVAVHTIGDVDSAPLLSALQAMEIRLGDPAQADLWLVLSDDYLAASLGELNAAALRGNHPWLLVRGGGRELWLGPLFQPGATGCWACMRPRLARNQAVSRFLADKRISTIPPMTARAALPATQAAVCEMAAVAAAQFLAGAGTALLGKLLRLDWATLASETHSLLRHPHCPACGTASDPEAQPIQLRAGKATFMNEGGHRTASPEATLQKYQHLVSPLLGVVRMLLPLRPDEAVAHVYMAGHNQAMVMDKLAHLRRGLRHMSSGKGMSAQRAKVGALCEAIERYSGEFTGGEPRVTRAWRDWSDGEAYHPNDCMLYSARQYADRDARNKTDSPFNRVPEVLPDDTPIDWSPLWSLTSGRHRYVPTQLVYFGARASQADESMYSVGCSNGNAAGDTLEEAILQGFFELVERDAVALWWYNRLRRPGVVVETFDEPHLLELMQHYRTRYRRETWALDVTSDLGIPVFVAVSREMEGEEERLIFGMGCHLDPRIALHRAFGEMNQMLDVAHTGEDGSLSIEDGETKDWIRRATVANQAYMAPCPEQPLRRFSDYPTQHSGEFLRDIDHCRSLIEAQGMEMLVLDQTRADVGMPVVKVVIPGLRHFWARYAPGRLYDVPVKMGWLEGPLGEDQLNPIPLFL